MDDNNIFSTDYVIGGPSTPEPTPAPEQEKAVEPTPATESAPVAESTPAAEPTPVETPSTASIYEQANDAATNPAPEKKIEETPIYTTSSSSSSMDSFSVPSTPTYASSDSNTYSSTYSSTYTSTSTSSTDSTTMATVSLILGILSIITGCCCCGNILFSIAGIICSVMQKPLSTGSKPGTATAGLITSIVGIVICIISVIATIALMASEGM